MNGRCTCTERWKNPGALGTSAQRYVLFVFNHNNLTSNLQRHIPENLQSIHKAEVCHGDLRYENLVINTSGKVAIDGAIMDAAESNKNIVSYVVYWIQE